MSPSLPPGWEERRAPDGRPYYVDHIHKKTQWARPVAQTAVAPPPPPMYHQPYHHHAPAPPAPPAHHAAYPPQPPQAVVVQAVSVPPQQPPVAVAYAQPVAVAQPPRAPTSHAGHPQPVVVQSWAAGTPPPATVNGGPMLPSGRRKALLVGINYRGTRAELRGCINDVRRMQDFLKRQGFPEHEMIVLTDNNPQMMPTRANILHYLTWLVQGAGRGDSLFFHFSGHGSQQEDETGDEADGFDETIVPCDYKRAGQITDDELWRRVVEPLPEGARLTSIMDCCHSGTGLDLAFNYIHGRGWSTEEMPAHARGDVQLFSGCEDAQTSADTVEQFKAGGAMTNAFLQALEENPLPLYPDFMATLHRNLRAKGFNQRPQLSSSQKFNLSDRVFSLTDGFIPNSNAQLGRIVQPGRRPKKRRNRRRFGNGLGFEGMLAAGAGGLLLGSLLS